MPAPPINMGTKEKVIRMVEIYFRCFTSRLCTFGYPPPTMHTKIASIFTAYTGRLRNAREMRGIFSCIFLLDFFKPMAKLNNLLKTLNDSSTIFKDTAQGDIFERGCLLFRV